eukprot:5219142-Pyramimonas_sp.AAC.1
MSWTCVWVGGLMLELGLLDVAREKCGAKRVGIDSERNSRRHEERLAKSSRCPSPRARVARAEGPPPSKLRRGSVSAGRGS